LIFKHFGRDSRTDYFYADVDDGFLEKKFIPRENRVIPKTSHFLIEPSLKSC
jgi:hypothetical protein